MFFGSIMLRRYVSIAWLVATVWMFTTPVMAQESSIEAALPMIRQSGNSASLIGALSGAAYQNHTAGRSDRAAELIDEAIAICRSSEDASQLSSCLMIAGQILNKLDSAAAKRFLVGLLGESSGNAEIEAAVLKSLGDQLVASGDLVTAIDVFGELTRKRAKMNPGTMTEAWALSAYGRACIAGRIFRPGIAALQKARAIAEEKQQPLVVTSCDLAIANAALNTGEYEVTKNILGKRYNEAMAGGDSSSLSLVLPPLVYALGNLDDVATARTLLDQAEPKMTALEKASMISLRQWIESIEGNFEAAIRHGEDAVAKKLAALPESMQAPFGAQTTMTDQLTLASLHCSDGNLAAAEAAADQADAGWQQVLVMMRQLANLGAASLDAQRTAASGIPQSIAKVRQRILLAKGMLDQALLQSEAARAQAMIEGMRQNFDAELPAPPQTLDLDQIKKLARDNDVTFVEYSILYATDWFTRGTLSPEHPLAIPESIAIWVVKPDGTIVHQSVRMDRPLAKVVATARNEILNHDAEESDPKASRDDEGAPTGLRTLHDWLIEPITPHLPDDPNAFVVFVPEEQLFAVPFVALPDQNGSPLIERHTLMQAASIESFGLSSRRQSRFDRSTAADILVVGNPSMPMYRYHPDKPAAPLDPLPGAEAEATAIASMFGIKALIGSAASESRVRTLMKKAPIIHLASHGLLESDNVIDQAYLSAIALAPVATPGSAARQGDPSSGTQEPGTQESGPQDPGTPESGTQEPGAATGDGTAVRETPVDADSESSSLTVSDDQNGFLTVREIMKMKLVADLAVLSACDSGRGKITGDGVVGLSRAYLMSGVPSVVVSLWPVSDRATALLMVRFYEALIAGDAKAVALRKATLAAREQFPEEKLWAAFTLYGSGR